MNEINHLKVNNSSRDQECIRALKAGFHWKQWAKYLWDYYRYPMLIAALLLVMALFFLTDLAKERKETQLYIAAVNCEVASGEAEGLQDALLEVLGLDAETDAVLLESSVTGRNNMASEATTAAYIRSGRVDLLIAPEQEFNTYATAGFLEPLDGNGYAELLNGLTERQLFYATLYDYSSGGAVKELPFAPHNSEDGARCYGIYGTEGVGSGYVIGIMANAPHVLYARNALGYLVGAGSV